MSPILVTWTLTSVQLLGSQYNTANNKANSVIKQTLINNQTSLSMPAADSILKLTEFNTYTYYKITFKYTPISPTQAVPINYSLFLMDTLTVSGANCNSTILYPPFSVVGEQSNSTYTYSSVYPSTLKGTTFKEKDGSYTLTFISPITKIKCKAFTQKQQWSETITFNPVAGKPLPKP
jgi:hypothetical protein